MSALLRHRVGALSVAACVVGLGLACQRHEPSAPPKPVEAAPVAVQWTDVTHEAGIAFTHQTGAFGKKWLPETMGSGCAWLDYDADGKVDLLLLNAHAWPGQKKKGPSYPALYRNKGDGTFEDATKRAGLAIEVYAMGLAVGDIDGDGRPDLFINALGPDYLLRNRGDGTFEDVTAKAGVSDPAFGSSATFFDYDHDGKTDLFVCNYVEWTPATDLFCTLNGRDKSYCTPESYKGVSDRLFRNRGDGRFEDVTKSAGVFNAGGKSLGVTVFDHDDDGWEDLLVANDTQPNYLYRNKGDGTFEEIGARAGLAFSEAGVARAGMGIDAGDYDGCGRESVVITNFANEMLGLYHNEGGGLYVDDAPQAGVGMPSLTNVGFGAFFFDYDLDGYLDLFVANGHVEPDVNDVQREVTYAQKPLLFRNLRGGKFEDAGARSGAAMAVPMVARGSAYADYDGDGDLDVVVTTNGGAARLLRNDGGSGNHWVRVDLEGSKCARDAVGARLILKAGGRTMLRRVKGATSYLSQSEPTITFGLGSAAAADSLEIRWPSGTRQVLGKIEAGKRLHIVESTAVASGS